MAEWGLDLGFTPRRAGVADVGRAERAVGATGRCRAADFFVSCSVRATGKGGVPSTAC
jgi:hypothetical protein